MTQTALPPSEATELNDSLRELREQIRELQSAVTEIRSEAAQYRADTQELRRELDATRAQLQLQARGAETSAETALRQANSANAGQTGENTADHLAKLEEEFQLLSGKVDEQYQTKVESASKYRVRLSGIVLFNLFSNQGRVDNLDIPSLAYPVPEGASGTSFGATLRQSQVGLEVFGPYLAGARTSADVQFDFAGGFPATLNGVNTGIVRLRTGTARMDWVRTSIVAGQDGLFFSPLTPTSFASLATPAFSYAGNLWGWTPQVRVEHRFLQSENSRFVVQGGIFDSLSGEPPPYEYYRQAQAGEASGQPAYASRVAWTGSVFGQPLTVGAGGYYGRQNYGFGRKVDGWAATTDWNLPLGGRFSLDGEFYRGRAVGGLGGGIGRSVLFSGMPSNPASAIQPLDSLGGWTQLKFRPAPKVELNAAFGQDNPYAQDLRNFPHGYAYLDAGLARNQAWMANVIFRPRSDLLLSAEYHHLNTFVITNTSYSADHINLMMGVLF
jgi:regulator of replication initiation timing